MQDVLPGLLLYCATKLWCVLHLFLDSVILLSALFTAAANNKYVRVALTDVDHLWRLRRCATWLAGQGGEIAR